MKIFRQVLSVFSIFMVLAYPQATKANGGPGTVEPQAPASKSIEEAFKPTETQVQNNDTNLTIYKDAALVKRRLPLPLEAGNQPYKIEGIAETIYPPSLMIELQSDSKSGQIQEYSLQPDTNLEEGQGNAEKSLHITISTKQADAQNHLMIFYLFRNLGWRADYTLELSPTYESLALNVWVEIINQSGISFNKAQIQLVDCDAPTTVKDSSPLNPPEIIDKSTLYLLNCPISLGKNSAKKVNWINSRGIQVQKQYRLYVGGKYLQDLNNKPAQPLVERWINFSNSQKQGLGLPLPAGQATLYSQNAHGNLELLGIIDIPAIATDQEISLKIPVIGLDKTATNDSHDVRAVSTIETVLEQTEFKKLTDKATEANYRLSLKNKGNKSVTIQVVLDLPVTNCKVIKENKAHTIDSLKQYSWSIEIPPESEIDLKYRLQAGLD